jgi:hypothetical protein
MAATLIIIAVSLALTTPPRYAHQLCRWMSPPLPRVNQQLLEAPPTSAEIAARPFDEIPLYTPPRPVPPIPNYWLTHDCRN